MTLDDIENNGSIVFRCISGSRAYGLDIATSDTDYKGIFILPEKDFYGLEYTEQVSNERNDIVYHELKKLFELLVKNNPTALELIATPQESVLYQHPVVKGLSPDIFLSKLCRDTFAGYAKAQIQKARGLNKKIVNPMSEERKGILDFCFVPAHQGSEPVQQWLDRKGFKQEFCGLVAIPHMRNTYGIYYSEDGRFSGIMKKDNSNEVALSTIEKTAEPVGFLYFNKDGYSKYCKDYKEYFDWVEKRNTARYESTLSHGKNYDAKNMMHTFRLLHMAEEIAREGRVIVKRPDREFLLKIRSGHFSYDELVEMAEVKTEELNELYHKSTLPEKPDEAVANQFLYEIRSSFYRTHIATGNMSA